MFVLQNKSLFTLIVLPASILLSQSLAAVASILLLSAAAAAEEALLTAAAAIIVVVVIVVVKSSSSEARGGWDPQPYGLTTWWSVRCGHDINIPPSSWGHQPHLPGDAAWSGQWGFWSLAPSGRSRQDDNDNIQYVWTPIFSGAGHFCCLSETCAQSGSRHKEVTIVWSGLWLLCSCSGHNYQFWYWSHHRYGQFETST